MNTLKVIIIITAILFQIIGSIISIAKYINKTNVDIGWKMIIAGFIAEIIYFIIPD
jgi:hypothetical protein